MKLNFKDLLKHANNAFNQKRAFVLYRKPYETTIYSQFQLSNNQNYNSDIKTSGFVFAPFDSSQKKFFFDSSNAECFESTFEELNFLNTNQFKITDVPQLKNQHIQTVKKAVNAIKQQEFDKLVISRKEELTASVFELELTFFMLLKKYPTAMVYCWYHPQVGIWMGATPELLCKITGNQFTTMALAGTQLAVQKSDVQWTQKEINEQQLVTDFITETIQPEIKVIKISDPETVQAGNLWHIKTTITGEISQHSDMEKLISKLHPTPAVCGLPKEKAFKFIVENENYNREFYTGYLGIIKKKEIELFVNLRCMKIENEIISIFVGGGITAASVPEKEWDETVAKAHTMKNVLF